MREFLTQARRFETWCRKDALPFWAEAARDPEGGFYEQLFLDGKPDKEHSRRVRVQARTAYVYAHAALLGWYDDAKPASDHAWRYLTTKGFAGGDQGCAHLLKADGSILDPLRDTYAQAFVLLAGAYRYNAFDDKRALNTAEDTLRFLDSKLKANNGGWQEGLPASLPRRQNPHMHLFEAVLVLYQYTGEPAYLQHAHDIYSLFEAHFFDKSGDIIEFFDGDWSRAEKNGGPAEPGHMMEWCWLLRLYETHSGIDVSQYANALFDRAINSGLNEKLGLLCDSVSGDGQKSGTLRSWPQTEYIKACAAQARAGQTDKLSVAANVIDRVFDTYLNAPITGGWHDQLDADGNIISQVMPTSTFYHWMCAAAEVSALADEISA